MFERFEGALLSLQRLRAAKLASEEQNPPPYEGKDVLEIRDGTLYSAKLMRTYNFVIIAIILVVGIIHWHGQIAGWRRQRTARLIEKANSAYDEGPLGVAGSPASGAELSHPSSGASSSGSSTLGVGTVQDTVKMFGDEDGSIPVYKAGPRRLPWAVLDSIQGFLAYQPRPIPLFNKTLPSNGLTIAGILFVALNIFYLLFNIHFTEANIIILSDRASLVFVVNLPVLYLFPAKTQPLSFITGYSYESLNIFHRRLGEILCLAAFMHGSLMFVGYFTFLRYIGFTFYTFIFNKTVLTGIAALTCYETLYFTSLASFRSRFYELFLGIHIILQLAGLTLLFFHHHNTRPYIGAALAIFTLDRLLYRIGLKSRSTVADLTILEDDRTVLLSATIPYRASDILSPIFGHDITRGWRATDHVFITCPTLGRKHVLQAHPFTVLSPSPSSLSSHSLVTGDSMKLDLLIRARDGFTSDLLKHAFMNRSLKIRIDGPYGGSHARDLLDGADQAILVAGGSGIAVVWPLVYFLLCRSPRSSDVEFSANEAMLKQRIVLIWVVQKTAHLSWLRPNDIEEVRSRGVEVVMPGPTQEDGRPDLEGMIAERVAETVVLKKGNRPRTAVVGSGPDSMGRDVRNACARLVGKGQNVKVLIEKFGW